MESLLKILKLPPMVVQTEGGSTSICENVFVNSYLKENIIHESLLPSDWRDSFPSYAKDLLDSYISYHKQTVYLLLIFKCHQKNELVQLPIRAVIHPKNPPFGSPKLPPCLILNSVFSTHNIEEEYRKEVASKHIDFPYSEPPYYYHVVSGSDRYPTVNPESDPNFATLISNQTFAKRLESKYVTGECPTCHQCVRKTDDQEVIWYNLVKLLR